MSNTIMTNIIMCALTLLLAFILLFKAKAQSGTEHFFNKDTSTAMRGFCCLVVVVIHAPEIYHSTVHDIITCFGYISITFYFLSSAYGLKFSMSKNPESIKYFWRNRLPKLLIPMLVGNIFAFVISIVKNSKPAYSLLLYFSKWVIWLLVCYFFFWLVYRFIKLDDIYKDIIICVLIALFSLVIYAFRNHITQTTWCTEIFGFAWGLILSHIKVKFPQFMRKRWLLSCIIACAVSGVLGVAYLKFKPIVFFGDYLLKIVLGLAILIFIFAINAKFSFGNKINMFLGKISYEVFLLHATSYGVVMQLFPNLNAGICIAVNLIFTIILAWMVHTVSGFIKKPVDRLLKKTYSK